MRLRGARLAVLSLVSLLSLAAPREAGALEADATAVRWTSPETGGVGRPRFMTRREVALLTRFEALGEGVRLQPGEYPERFVRAAIERHVAREMLAALFIQRGTEPPNLPRLAQLARAELEERLGGKDNLTAALTVEGLTDAELDLLLRDRVRAGYHVDRAITPIFRATEEALREAHRAAIHPFRERKFEDCRDAFREWFVVERQRAAETEFFQGARTRVRIVFVDERSR